MLVIDNDVPQAHLIHRVGVVGVGVVSHQHDKVDQLHLLFELVDQIHVHQVIIDELSPPVGVEVLKGVELRVVQLTSTQLDVSDDIQTIRLAVSVSELLIDVQVVHHVHSGDVEV